MTADFFSETQHDQLKQLKQKNGLLEFLGGSSIPTTAACRKKFSGGRYLRQARRRAVCFSPGGGARRFRLGAAARVGG